MARGFYRRWDHVLPSRADRLTLEVAAIRRSYRLRSKEAGISKDSRLHRKRRVSGATAPLASSGRALCRASQRPTLAQTPNFFTQGCGD
jgi:hypothetical protein